MAPRGRASGGLEASCAIVKRKVCVRRAREDVEGHACTIKYVYITRKFSIH